MLPLTPEEALIFRITHIANVPWLLANGVHCPSSTEKDPNHISIGNPDLIERRQHRLVPVPPGGTLSDYVPFYFTPCSPMLHNITTGYGVARRPMSEIVILVSSLVTLRAQDIPFLFSDRHAYLIQATFSNELTALAGLPWNLWQAKDFARNPSDPAKFERYQAEALVYKHLPVSALHGIVCFSTVEQAALSQVVQNTAPGLAIDVKPEWYV